MKTKLEVLYSSYLMDAENEASCFGTPVVRYSDACAAIAKLEAELELKERLRANAVARCELLLKELHESKPKLTVHAGNQCGHSLPRWDGPAKVL